MAEKPIGGDRAPTRNHAPGSAPSNDAEPVVMARAMDDKANLSCRRHIQATPGPHSKGSPNARAASKGENEVARQECRGYELPQATTAPESKKRKLCKCLLHIAEAPPIENACAPQDPHDPVAYQQPSEGRSANTETMATA